MEDLGSGFYLAMHDLEIRGAGEVLGDNQSGEMQEVGFNLFNDMLASAVKSLKAGKEPDIDAPMAVTTEINLHLPALLPEDYCGDIHERSGWPAASGPMRSNPCRKNWSTVSASCPIRRVP
jgi:transcription-repair coupling factor (superfamily II helicase)